MKRSTAIRHLVEMAKVATDRLRLRTDELDWPLDELWVAGALLESVDELDHGSVVLMIDLPTDDLPWLAVHPTAEWIGEQLRLGKRPLSWSYRPSAWPAWTYRDQRVARFWSASEGLDQEAIEALHTGRTPEVIEPGRDELIDQLGVELGVAKTHLRSILDDYWDHDWRRVNRHHATPENQLWRAATAVTEIKAHSTILSHSRATSRNVICTCDRSSGGDDPSDNPGVGRSDPRMSSGAMRGPIATLRHQSSMHVDDAVSMRNLHWWTSRRALASTVFPMTTCSTHRPTTRPTTRPLRPPTPQEPTPTRLPRHLGRMGQRTQPRHAALINAAHHLHHTGGHHTLLAKPLTTWLQEHDLSPLRPAAPVPAAVQHQPRLEPPGLEIGF